MFEYLERSVFATMLAAVDSGRADFALLDSEDTLWFTRNQPKNSVAVFPYGELKEVGWGFRKDDKELQAVFEQFWQAQQRRLGTKQSMDGDARISQQTH